MVTQLRKRTSISVTQFRVSLISYCQKALSSRVPLPIPTPDPNDANCKLVVAMISDALCHARFYGDNPASDEVPLMKILQVRMRGRGKGKEGDDGGRRREGRRRNCHNAQS